MELYLYWSEFPRDEWEWPNFQPKEIACRGTGKLGIDRDAMTSLQRLRDMLGTPLILNSAYRSPEHNRRVGGAKASQHMLGKAFDVSMANQDPEKFEEAARACGFRGIGHYPKSGFMHIDTRETPAKWHGAGGWFKPRNQIHSGRFEPEPEPTPRVVEAARDGGAAVVIGMAAETALREASAYAPGQWGEYLILSAVAISFGLVVWRLVRKRSSEPEE